jgi:hypothetical protein
MRTWCRAGDYFKRKELTVKRFSKLIFTFMLVLAMLAGVIGSINLIGVVQPEPAEAAGTVLIFNGRNEPAAATFNTDPVDVSDYTTLDIQHAIDQADTVNTATIKLQNSINGWDWADQLTIVTDNAADATAITETNRVGKYVRFEVTLANTETVTPEIVVLAE